MHIIPFTNHETARTLTIPGVSIEDARDGAEIHLQSLGQAVQNVRNAPDISVKVDHAEPTAEELRRHYYDQQVT